MIQNCKGKEETRKFVRRCKKDVNTIHEKNKMWEIKFMQENVMYLRWEKQREIYMDILDGQ